MKDKIINIIICIFFIFLLLLFFSNLSFVFAEHVVRNSTMGTSYVFDEDVTNLINISVNISDIGQPANVTSVNISLWGNFSFLSNSNGTDARESGANYTFTNTSLNLLWINSTEYLINGSEVKYFWFNATAPNPGTFQITVTTVNGTNSYDSNITVTINDLAPNVSAINTPASSANLSGSTVLNATVSNRTLRMDSVYFNITNSTGNQVAFVKASTMAPNYWNATFNTATLTSGVHNITVFANDSSNNINNTERVRVTVDNTPPSVKVLSPVSIGYGSKIELIQNFIDLQVNVSENIFSVDSCYYSLNGGATNFSMANISTYIFNVTNFTMAYINYTASFYCNDTLGNLNATEKVIFGLFNPSTSFYFNGTTHRNDGVSLNFTNITVLVRDNTWTQVGLNSTLTNATGWFNMVLPLNTSWMYQPTLVHMNATYNYADYVGQSSLPAFPYAEISRLPSINYYLQDAGTINITVVNRTGGFVPFGYMVKDTSLSFPVSNGNVNGVESVIYLQRNKNYSIMVYPSGVASGNWVPVTFEWNNFTSTNSYNLTNISSYNATTKIIQKTFNVTESFARINGYFDGNSLGVSGSWDELVIVPLLSEGGNTVVYTYGVLPYNGSALNGQSDFYNKSSGNYSITLPYAPEETVSYILFASARNGSTYYGSYKNITVTGGLNNFNFTMYGLLGVNGTINMSVAGDTSRYIVNTSKQTFTLVNFSNNATLVNTKGHVEVTVDYSNFGAKEFTFMEEIAQTGNATFSLPLINATGVKEINVYSMDYSPKRVPTLTSGQITINSNISMKTFNPQSINGSSGSSINFSMYRSNSSCDVPSPPAPCLLTSSNMDAMNMFSVVIGGGSLSFRMGLGGVLVHYVNVDMLASGPPDALFDDNAGITEGVSGGFSKAMRFGSQGPTIYNYVLISMPYTEGAANSSSGLDESRDVYLNMTNLYDDSWNVIWNIVNNGTNASALAGNDSHYNVYQNDWQDLLEGVNCTRTVSDFNASRPCFLDTTNNRIWVRIPHFSGTGPNVDGTSVVVTSSSSSSSSGGGSFSSSGFWTKTTIVTGEEFENGYTKEIAKKERVRVKVKEDSKYHYVGVISVSEKTATINVSSESQQAVLNIGDTRKFDVTGDGFYDLTVKLESVANNKAELTIKAIREKVTEESQAKEQKMEEDAKEQQKANEKPAKSVEGKSSVWTGVIIVVFVLVIAGVIIFYLFSKKNKKQKRKFI